ncbi:DUF461 domain-containing protein [Kitasatospora sp. YST-16]|uniref:hypothetical protein n=1 Tax=unclassified Kitasatospora TaxID=2633591 RepID=UPI0004C315EE|nr:MULTISPECIES: hypothetical protein [unclassified Kitasatospora]WAL72480.1 DUF461 domain-containing protein [Kitasatospora sp. YST-16]WNW38530.1 DUF461 domain-containing protein [Streptomyces sp. Li-HN-5-13]
MSRSLRRGAVAAIVLAAILPLAACATGNDASTLQIKPDNAATSVGDGVKLNNIVVVTEAGSAGAYTGPATVTVNIANAGATDDVLTSVKIGDATAKLTDENGAPVSTVDLKVNQSVLLGAQGSPVAQVSSSQLSVGGYVKTTFTFAKAGEVSAQANVQPAVGSYEAFGPKKAAPSPSASASASAPAAGASGSPSAGATASGSASAPASPSGSASAH